MVVSSTVALVSVGGEEYYRSFDRHRTGIPRPGDEVLVEGLEIVYLIDHTYIHGAGI